MPEDCVDWLNELLKEEQKNYIWEVAENKKAADKLRELVKPEKWKEHETNIFHLGMCRGEETAICLVRKLIDRILVEKEIQGEVNGSLTKEVL